MLNPGVVFDDKAIMILDKPAGWVVNDAKTAHGNPIIQNWLRENFKYQISGSVEMRSGVVHRLDKETSGILIIAKDSASYEELQRQFKEKLVKKQYTALVHGRVSEKEGVVSAPLARLPWNRERFGVLSSGKLSETGYEVVEYYKDEKGAYYSLLKIFPKTGRTHQIRVHMKHIGRPIVSDTFYAGRKTSRNDRKWCNRLFLHASVIEFIHPTNHKKVRFVSQLPEDLKRSLAKLTLI